MSESLISQRIPHELLQCLAEHFPDQVPDIKVPIDEVRARAGEQRVIRWLRHQYDLQNENILAE